MSISRLMQRAFIMRGEALCTKSSIVLSSLRSSTQSNWRKSREIVAYSCYLAVSNLLSSVMKYFVDVGSPPRSFVPLPGLSGGCQIEMLNPACQPDH